MRPSEQRRIAALQAHHYAKSPCRVGEPFVNEALRGGMAARALPDGNFFSPWSERQRFRMDERIVKNHIGFAEHPDRSHREEVRRARPGADEVNDPHQPYPRW